MPLKIIQWNVRSLKHKLNEINGRFSDADIFIFSGTWLSPLDNVLVKDFDLIRKVRRDRKGGGVAICIRSTLKYKLIKPQFDLDGEIEICTIKLFEGNEELIIAALYRPPSGCAFSLSSWVRIFSQFNSKVIFGGDLNIHCASLGSPYS